MIILYRAIYKVFNLVGHFVLATQGFARSLYICNGNSVLAKQDLIGHFAFLLGK